MPTDLLLDNITMNYYTVKVFARKCILDIKINDMPLIRQELRGDISFERPINHLIEKSGEQNLEINTLPISLEDSKAEYNVEVWRYDASGLKLTRGYNVMTVSSKENEADWLMSSLSNKRCFIAEVGYVISRWSGCETIKVGRKIAPMVVSFMKDLSQILSTKQYDRYAQLIATRERNICKSLYLGEAEVKKRMGMLVDCLNSGFELVPLEGHKKLQYYGNRRVITIIGEDMKSALQFTNPMTGEILSLEILLGFPLGKAELSII